LSGRVDGDVTVVRKSIINGSVLGTVGRHATKMSGTDSRCTT
jgi:hypothetical protein